MQLKNSLVILIFLLLKNILEFLPNLTDNLSPKTVLSAKLMWHPYFQIAKICCKYNVTWKICFSPQLQAERMSHTISFLLVLVYCQSRWQKFAFAFCLYSWGSCGQTIPLNFTLIYSEKQIKNMKVTHWNSQILCETPFVDSYYSFGL